MGMARQADIRPDTRDTASERQDAPSPEDPRKPDDPGDLSKRSWKFIVRKTLREFSSDECTDLAAALTYYAVLSVFPAIVALISLVGLLGQGQQSADALLGIVEDLGPQTAVDLLRDPINQVVNQPAAGLGFVIGLLAALWSASGYVGAFGRAMNRVYEIDEGRPFWKLRPLMMAVTVLAVVLLAAASLGLVVSGKVAEALGTAMGLDDTVVTVWNIVKWPILLGLVVIVVAVLYYATPNVRQPKFRWISLGATVAIIVWILASVIFAFYVANFSSYDKTYGSLAGIIVFLLWLWITNLALLFGAELDAEVERGRQLQAGIAAEETIQLPPRDTSKSDKAAKKEEADIRAARELREQSDERGGSAR
jgi:membrane protein